MSFRRFRTLVIDNYDSYTFNLVQYIAQVNLCLVAGDEYSHASDVNSTKECLSHFVDVIQNDQISWPQLRERIEEYDNIILSPGPGHPGVPADFGVCYQVLEKSISLDDDRLDIPILGVCLGHQGLAVQCDWNLELAPKAAHGIQSSIEHCGKNLFEGVPNPFLGVRYHSWIVTEERKIGGDSVLKVNAWTIGNNGERLIMGLEHRHRPIWGVQFHPESICTQEGMTILKNFARISSKYRKENRLIGATPAKLSVPFFISQNPEPPTKTRNFKRYTLVFKKLRLKKLIEPADIYHELFMSHRFALSENGTETCSFWLDSSHPDRDLCRYSIMGSPYWSPRGCLIEYDQATKMLVRSTWKKEKVIARRNLTLHRGTLFSWMNEKQSGIFVDTPKEYSIPFCGGYIGYFGYEMKHECNLLSKISQVEESHQPREPDAAWMLVHNFLAFDACDPCSIYIVELRDMDNEGSQKSWIDQMEKLIFSMSTVSIPSQYLVVDTWPHINLSKPSFYMEQDELCYKESIRRCLEKIRQGESYELCLTNKVIIDPFPLEPYCFYRYLRKVNPAPYSAWLEFPGFSILSSSPEKFLTIDSSSQVVSKPIKGTVHRGSTMEQDEELKTMLKTSQKEFSENLMIVDLVRHDLGKVCQIGSISVPDLMKVESYRTVHQLVSKITGKLRRDKTTFDCIQELFPPASMTGAPKFRSVEILQKLEKFKRRGVYSGALGYISFSGECDLSVVIRTAVVSKRGASPICFVGCGGAIVIDSDIEQEFEEVILKANSLLYTTLKVIYDCALHTETDKDLDVRIRAGLHNNKEDAGRGSLVEIQTENQLKNMREEIPQSSGLSEDRSRHLLGRKKEDSKWTDDFELFFLPIQKTLCHTIRPVFIEKHDPEAKVPIRWVDSRPGLFRGTQYIEELGTTAIDLGLKRILPVLTFFSNPQEAYPIIHVTGTNGKGSVCSILSCVLEESGYTVGLFTSPFLLSWYESICVNQTPIQTKDWDWILYRISEAASKLGVVLTQFEALTICAFLYFRDRHVDVAVIEVGMGGRLDATNVAKKSLVSVITSIGYDHEAFLGSTLREITREKAGILKFECPAVVSRILPEEAIETIKELAQQLNVPLISDKKVLSSLTWENAQIDPAFLSLSGQEQLSNLEVATTVLKVIKNQFDLINLKSIENGLMKVRWPGRKQYLIWANGMKILIDGAHNPSGVQTLRQFLNVYHPNQKIQWILGMLSSKDHEQFLRQCLSSGDSIWTVPVIPNVSWHHSIDQQTLLFLARDVKGDLNESASFSSLRQALKKLEDPEWTQKGLLPVVTGSLHLISNLLKLVHARQIHPFILPTPKFSLLETLLWTLEPEQPLLRFSDLEDHLKRLRCSAQYFGFKVHVDYIKKCLAYHSQEWVQNRVCKLKVRVLVNQDGDTSVDASPLLAINLPYKIQICKFPVDSAHPFIRHKTTNRSLYQFALESVSRQMDDVILWNERGEITETTIANIEVKFLSSDGRVQWITPHESSGLLKGIEREKRIRRGELQEKVLKLEDIKDREIYLINSVRGRWKAELVWVPQIISIAQ